MTIRPGEQRRFTVLIQCTPFRIVLHDRQNRRIRRYQQEISVVSKWRLKVAEIVTFRAVKNARAKTGALTRSHCQGYNPMTRLRLGASAASATTDAVRIMRAVADQGSRAKLIGIHSTT